VQDSREDLTQRRSSNATEPRVTVSLRPEDVDTLQRLQEAGLIDIPGLDLSDDNPCLVDWTWDELEEYLLYKRRNPLAEGTVRQTLNWLQFLEAPDESYRWTEDFPPPPGMELRPPREEEWQEIVAYYLAHGKDGNTLNNHRLALKRLLDFLRRERGASIDSWESLEGKISQSAPDRPIPPDDVVPEFWAKETDRHPDLYIDKLCRAVFHFNFHAGLRSPSELADLELDNVDFETDRITYWEEKKDRWRRRVKFPTFLVSAKNGPSLKWYVDHVRSEVDTGDSDALFLTLDGEAWTHRAMGKMLGRVGKRIWPTFYGYCMRHWFATHFLLANEFNLKATAERLGDTTAVVEKFYLDDAKVRAEVESRYQIPRFRNSGGI